MQYKPELPNINIIKKNENEAKYIFEVEVSDKLSKTNHTVTLNKSDFEKLKKGKINTPEELIIKSFEFLLKREPKDVILKKFDIMQISHYFHEFEREVTK